MTRVVSRALVAVVLAAGCSGSEPSTQVLTGKVGTSGAIAVRAVIGDSVVTASQVRSDGTFTLALPKGEHYRLEVLTTSGVRHVFSGANGTLADMTFSVCQPSDPYDMGGVGTPPDIGPPPGGGMGGGTPGCDPQTEMCPPPPPPCDPSTDPNCACDPTTDPTCGLTCDPGDPDCPVQCSNPMDPGCDLPPTPGCADPTDPYCFCDANGDCPPPYCGPTTMDPNAPDVMCPPPPPPPCQDPTDPTTCGNPCEQDPASCGCSTMDQSCWPPPLPPECDAMGEMCDPNGPGGITPENPPTDFGCEDQPTMDPPNPPEPGNPGEPGDPGDPSEPDDTMPQGPNT